MSSLLRRPAGLAGLAVDELDERDRAALTDLVRTDSTANAVLDARLHALRGLGTRNFGGPVVGVRDSSARLTAAAFCGGTLLPAGADAEHLAALAERIASRPRPCSSIVGPASTVAPMWAVLEPAWGPPRVAQRRQPLLSLDTCVAVAPDERVATITPEQLDAYLPAAAAMFTEELGVSPYRSEGAGRYRRRVADLVRDRRALGIVDEHGEVVFKADLGAITPYTCQVQGVWVHPARRGRGLGTAAMAAVLAHALTLAPAVSLYVNDFNIAARRMYDTLGMRQVGTLTTILF